MRYLHVYCTPHMHTYITVLDMHLSCRVGVRGVCSASAASSADAWRHPDLRLHTSFTCRACGDATWSVSVLLNMLVLSQQLAVVTLLLEQHS